MKAALKSQYHAALAMLKEAVELCPDNVWTSGKPPRQFWRLAYHTLFFTNMYLGVSVDDFKPWAKHRDEVESDAERETLEPTPYTKADILEYLEIVDSQVDSQLDRADLNSQECGIPWYKMPKLDHVIMNLRHVQEHTGQFRDRLLEAGVDVRWVGKA